MFDAEKLCMKCMKGTMSDKFCAFCGSPVLTAQEIPNALPLRSILNGRYLVGSVLGAGGFGVTYMGYDLGSNRRVAIKEFMPTGMIRRAPGTTAMQVIVEGTEFASSMDRFMEEARIIYHYQNNPHILQVYSLFQENGTAYYVMEFLEGSDLKHYLKKKGGKLAWNEVMPIALQVIDALLVLHRDGVVHRDISPDNIYISPTGKVTLIDFGAARLFVAQKQLTVILKRKYAPIEQYESRGKQGPWTDIYALAATLYNALTGMLPPEATSRAYRDEMKSFRECGVMLEPKVENALYRALRVEPRDRYQTVEAFRNDLLGIAVSKRMKLVGISGIYQGMELTPTGEMTIGRNPAACQLIYPAGTKGVSSIHCQVKEDASGGGILVRDMGSTYGTWVNGTRLEQGVFKKLSLHDRILFGENQLWQVETAN